MRNLKHKITDDASKLICTKAIDDCTTFTSTNLIPHNKYIIKL